MTDRASIAVLIGATARLSSVEIAREILRLKREYRSVTKDRRYTNNEKKDSYLALISDRIDQCLNVLPEKVLDEARKRETAEKFRYGEWLLSQKGTISQDFELAP